MKKNLEKRIGSASCGVFPLAIYSIARLGEMLNISACYQNNSSSFYLQELGSFAT